ncbi:MAG: xanthine dehydrogenase family protein subunit M [Nitrospinaceae bacterium]|nr:xanthine dehydrogenase family protein subunit M [Nitrospinaceae bacterium]
MIPASFDYLRPETLEEAIGLLEKHGDEAKLLAGGHSLLPVLKARLASPGVLIDIGRIPALSGITRDEKSLIIGAMTTHYQIESSPEILKLCPLLAETAAEIGDVQVRNRATIGGAIAHADPAADYPAALIALDAEFVVTGPTGARSYRAENFFEGTFETAMAENEILTSVQVPISQDRSGSAYGNEAQQSSGFAICGVAAIIGLNAEGNVEHASVGITGVTAAAYRATGVERTILGMKPTEENIADAALHATDDVEPFEDLYGSADFRRNLARVWTARTLKKAAQEANE